MPNARSATQSKSRFVRVPIAAIVLPMNEFTALRTRAKERRDLAITAARSNYEAAMLAIAELENSLLDRGKPKVKGLRDCGRLVMPTDRPFTIEEILESLQVLDPARIWRRIAVGNAIRD